MLTNARRRAPGRGGFAWRQMPDMSDKRWFLVLTACMTEPSRPGPVDRGAVRTHRALQSTWREKLGRPPGPPTDPRARARYDTIVNCLPEEHQGVRAEDEGLNLMSPAAVRYTRERLETLERVGGLAEPDRLWRNLLSSQPLAFSIVGELREHPAAAAAVMAELTGHAVVGFDQLTDPVFHDYTLDRLEAEWFPPRDRHTGDRSGFDIAGLLRLGDGSRLLVTVEVKYIDSFSPAKLNPSRYAPHLDALGLGDAAVQELVRVQGSQFLRSVMLTESVRRHGIDGTGAGVDRGLAVVLARGDDRSARRVADAFGQHQMPTSTAMWTHEQLFNAAGNQPSLQKWAQRMAERYLPPD